MIALQIAMGFQALMLGLLVVFGSARFWEICLLAVVLGLNNAFENSARQAFVREMAGKDELRNAITLNSVTVNAARAAGPAIGGVLIATAGIGACFLLNAASFAAVVTSLLIMDRSALRPSPPSGRASGQLREGLRYAARTPAIAIPLAMTGLVGHGHRRRCSLRAPLRLARSRPGRRSAEGALRSPRMGRRLIRSWGRSATGWSGRGGRSWRLRWGRRPLSWATYWARIVRRCRWPKMSIRSVTSVRAVSTNRSA